MGHLPTSMKFYLLLLSLSLQVKRQEIGGRGGGEVAKKKEEEEAIDL